MTDVFQDGESVFGLSTQFQQAALDATILRSANLGAPLTFTGHSLGGGLASLAALVIDGNAITFNALGLSNATLNTFSVFGQSQNNITAMIVNSDPLNTGQQMTHYFNPNINTAAGNQQFITSTIIGSLNVLTYHSIDTIIQSLEHIYEFRLW